MKTRRKILHVDMDAFGVSVERIRNRGLVGRPVIIGNDAGGRGVVSCVSYEARRLGAYAGMPCSLARRRFPQAVFLPENRAEYECFSFRLLEVFQGAAPVVEAASIDDFYLDLTGCESLFGGDLARWAVKLARRVYRSEHVPMSLGLGSNKMVARIATSLAKPAHIMQVPTGDEQAFLAPVKIELIPGIGEKIAARLHSFGIHTAGQLASMSEEHVHLLFGTGGEELWRRAQGEFHEEVKPSTLHRVISHTHTLTPDTTNRATLEAGAILLAQRLLWDLRRHGLRCNQATLEVTYTDEGSSRRSLHLEQPTDQDFDMIAPVRQALAGCLTRRVRVRKLRLSAPFVPTVDAQYDLFHERMRRSRRGLLKAIDEVREKHGFKALFFASGKE